MPDISILLFEPGMPETVPGIPRNCPALSFPIWGNFSFLDLHRFNFSIFKEHNEFKKYFKECNEYLLFEENQKKAALKVISYLKKTPNNCLTLEEEIPSLVENFKKLPGDFFILCSLAFAAFLDFSFLLERIKTDSNSAWKISTASTPLDCYIFPKKKFLEQLRVQINLGKQSPVNFIFKDVLNAGFDDIVEIPGEILFHNNAMQLYTSNMKLLSALSNKFYINLCKHWDPLEIPGSAIGKTGTVLSSYIGAGVEIHGTVKNSIVFSNVYIGKETEISNSVIMSGNKIGENSVIKNTLIFPFFDESVINEYNIKDKVFIGGEGGKNKLYPNHMEKGISIVGTDAKIPRGFIMEAATYVGPRIDEKELRRIEMIKKGGSVEKNIESPHND